MTHFMGTYPAQGRGPRGATWIRVGLLTVVLAAVLLAAVACLGATKALQLPADFQIAVYQGAEEMGGQTVAFASLFNKGKPVVLNFWAGLCPPCRVEMPAFQRVYEGHRNDLILFGLDVGVATFLGTQADAKALLQELQVTFPVGTLMPGTANGVEVLASYEVQGIPTTVFLASDGRVYRTWVGPLNEAKLNELVEGLLAFSEG
ncbi:MAG: TlpA family protein disulfide reductase [Dehalococcoidia bacterium]|nr:TlpA family protein disulfide reductase [Dehalococcoidia bacterium]